MRRVLLLGLAAVLLTAAAAVPARAFEILTSIDLDYTYGQTRLNEDVLAATGYNQRYGIVYSASTALYDVIGAVRLELLQRWDSRTGDTSSIHPTIEIGMKGSQALFKGSYDGLISTVGAFRETAEAKSYSTALVTEAQLSEDVWPELDLKFQSKRDYQPLAKDITTTTYEIIARKDFTPMRLEFDLKKELIDTALPSAAKSDDLELGVRASYRDVIYGGVDLELGYDIQDSDIRLSDRGVFQSDTATYIQKVRSRLRKPMELSPRLTLALTWEYEFDQDLLQIAYDTKFNNRYDAELRYEMLDWARFVVDVRRETTHTEAFHRADELGQVIDTLQFGGDLDPLSWLKFSTKGQMTETSEIKDLTGASLDLQDEEKFEHILRNTFGSIWDLTLTASSRFLHTNGWLTEKETQFKGDVVLHLAEDLTAGGSYQTDITTDWLERHTAFDKKKRTDEAKINFEYRRQFLDLLTMSFSHQYDVKIDEDLDSVLTFTRTAALNEETRLSFGINDLLPGLTIEGEVDRKGSDNEGDGEKMLVDVGYMIRIGYVYDAVSLSTSLRYDSKRGTYDDLSFNAHMEWRGDQLGLVGEYEFDKVYSDTLQETRMVSLKLSYRF